MPVGGVVAGFSGVVEDVEGGKVDTSLVEAGWLLTVV
jgi:hypothetical protein